jgi:hypothetical protein
LKGISSWQALFSMYQYSLVVVEQLVFTIIPIVEESSYIWSELETVDFQDTWGVVRVTRLGPWISSVSYVLYVLSLLIVDGNLKIFRPYPVFFLRGPV